MIVSFTLIRGESVWYWLDHAVQDGVGVGNIPGFVFLSLSPPSLVYLKIIYSPFYLDASPLCISLFLGDIISLVMIGTYGVFNKKSLLGLYDRGSLSLSTCLIIMAGSAETPLREM